MITTREQWLTDAVEALRPIFAEVEYQVEKGKNAPKIRPEIPTVRVSCGWPSRGGTGTGNRVIGQCWGTSLADDKVAQLFISPVLHAGTDAEGVKLLGVLLHELVHAVDDCKSGHKGVFAKIAKGIGLTGKMTATTVGEELAGKLRAILAELGEYPHARLNPSDPSIKKQTTRMLKIECPNDGYIVRTTAKWLDEMGTPTCPCGERMIEA